MQLHTLDRVVPTKERKQMMFIGLLGWDADLPASERPKLPLSFWGTGQFDSALNDPGFKQAVLSVRTLTAGWTSDRSVHRLSLPKTQPAYKWSRSTAHEKTLMKQLQTSVSACRGFVGHIVNAVAATWISGCCSVAGHTGHGAAHRQFRFNSSRPGE